MPEVALLTPIAHGRAQALRACLRGLPTSPRESSPFANLWLGTHFARFVVISVGEPQLLFTSRFDGDEREYLSRLAAREQAWKIWEHCVKPDPVNEDSLRDYLLDDAAARVPESYVVCALQEQDTVARINAAMALQDELARFATRAQGLDAIDLAHAFRELTPVREIAEQ